MYASIQRLPCPSIANRKGRVVVDSFLWANAANGLMGRDSQPPTKRRVTAGLARFEHRLFSRLDHYSTSRHEATR